MKRFTCLPGIFLLFFSLWAAETITDEHLGYSIVLPDNWVREVVSNTNHRFVDTTSTYQSHVALVRYDFSAEQIFETSDDWTRANFIAYSFVIEADPLSVLIFYDTVTVLHNGNFWATDAYSETYSTDTQMVNWAEYIRYTALGTLGYELYAIGPLDDMNENVGFYKGIIDSIILPETPQSVSHKRIITPVTQRISSKPQHQFNLLGQNIPHTGWHQASQVIVTRTHRSCLLK